MAKKALATRPQKLAGRVRVWAILGESDAGKSTVIGHLVSQYGKGAGGLRVSPLRGGGDLRIYARRQSVQEAKRTPDDVIADTYKSAVKLQKKHGIVLANFNLLIALRTDVTNRMPMGHAYLSRFIAEGWDLSSIVVLNYQDTLHAAYREFGAPFLGIEDNGLIENKSMHNLLVSKVRNHFGWA